MNIDITPIRVAVAVAAAGFLLTAFLVFQSSVESKNVVNRCFKRCDEYRSMVIDNQCFCSTDWGWITAGTVKTVITKMNAKCETTHQRRRR